jgi:acetyltransferase
MSMDASEAATLATHQLPSGERVILRPIRPDDAPRLQALAPRLSNETIYRRFFTARRVLYPNEAEYLANVDGELRQAIVAERTAEHGPEVIGVARYDTLEDEEPRTAEIAILVEDRLQRQGLGRVLLTALIRVAHANGIMHLAGDFLTENQPVIGLLRGAGYPITFKTYGSEVHFSMDISRTEQVCQ